MTCKADTSFTAVDGNCCFLAQTGFQNVGASIGFFRGDPTLLVEDMQVKLLSKGRQTGVSGVAILLKGHHLIRQILSGVACPWRILLKIHKSRASGLFYWRPLHPDLWGANCV